MAADADRLWVGSMPEAYEQGLARAVFDPFAVDLAERVVALSPHRVLELAAGTGALTRALAESGGHLDLVATDLNDAMASYGQTHVPQARWQRADATELPFGADAFDVVACQFGVMFFPDKQAAFAEAGRVLSPGGALVFNTWAAIEQHDFQSGMVDVLERLYPEDPPTFFATMPHGYADPDLIVADLGAAGFGRVDVEEVTCEGHAASAHALAVGYCTGTPLRAALEARSDLQSATTAIASAFEERFGAGPVVGRMTAIVIVARASD